MKAPIKVSLLAVMLPILALSVVATVRPLTGALIKPLGPIPADPTEYDCRQIVKVERDVNGTKTFRLSKRCPHLGELAAGKCDYDFARKHMRCTG
jgi:hypothetical protein